MSLEDTYWGDRGHCPKCGRFCGAIVGFGSEDRGLYEVRGECHRHGDVDLTGQEWSWEDFFGESALPNNSLELTPRAGESNHE